MQIHNQKIASYEVSCKIEFYNLLHKIQFFWPGICMNIDKKLCFPKSYTKMNI